MAKAMTATALRKHVQELGDLREELGRLKSAERDLTTLVQGAIENNGGHVVESRDYAAQLAERRTLSIDPVKFRRKTDEKLFLECIRVDVRNARRHLSDAELEKVGAYSTSVSLRVSRRVK